MRSQRVHRLRSGLSRGVHTPCHARRALSSPPRSTGAVREAPLPGAEGATMAAQGCASCRRSARTAAQKACALQRRQGVCCVLHARWQRSVSSPKRARYCPGEAPRFGQSDTCRQFRHSSAGIVSAFPAHFICACHSTHDSRLENGSGVLGAAACGVACGAANTAGSGVVGGGAPAKSWSSTRVSRAGPCRTAGTGDWYTPSTGAPAA